MEHSALITRRTLAVTVVISVVTSTVFGFSAGFIASSPSLREKALAAVSPGFRDFFNGKTAMSPEAEGSLTATIPQGGTQEEQTVAVVEHVSPAVVSIVVSKDVPTYEQYYTNPGAGNPLFNQFFGNMQVPQYRQNGTQNQEIGAGSGFLVTADGYIVTNRHVVSDEQAQYTVVLQDGGKYDAKVLGRDPVNDIAVLKIEKKPAEGETPADGDFPFLAFGDSSQLKVGQSVIAIGYSLGRFSNTVSTGIVSGLERRIQAGDGRDLNEDLFGVIQTDTAINPGNSGGPLLNLRGEVIGVNVAIVQGSQNIGFSLPANDVKKVADSVRTGGKISRPFFGVRYVLITKELKEKNQLSVDYGALVSRGQNADELAVMPGSPADIAGIVENDIILEVGGTKIDEDHPLQMLVAKLSAGQNVILKVLHKGVAKTIEVTLTERK